jgi:outer membrane biosynthesis protein TonB
MTSERKSNQWIEHCKAYAKEHGCSYKIAIKEAKASYVPMPKVKKAEPQPEPEPAQEEILVIEPTEPIVEKVKKPRKPKVKKE